MENNQQRVHRRRRRNLPAELKVEIVDCLPLENAVHFLANVPNRLIIHHCAPRIRAMMPKMIDRIVFGYPRTLPAANSYGCIWLQNGHHYRPHMDIFLRYGAAHCRNFGIFLATSNSDGFIGYPANFFNNLIKHYYETKAPTKVVRELTIELSLTNPAPWPTALVQPQAGEMKLEELKVKNDWKLASYILRNKHNPRITFLLHIHFQEGAKCYQQMTRFIVW